MPRTAEAHKQIRDVRRAQALDAALRVFAWNGLSATRMSDIAREAGISQGLLYHYFEDKAALFSAVVEEALSEAASITANACNGPGSAWERLEVLVTRLIESMLRRPESALVITQAFATRLVPPETHDATRKYGVQTHQDITALIAAGQREGSVAAGNPVELSFALTACIQGIALSRLQAESDDPALPSPAVVLRLLKP